MNYPEVRIRYGWLLSNEVSRPLNELWGDGMPLRTLKEYETIVASYKKAWQPYEEKILKSMCDTLGLSFRQNIVDVYIAPWMAAFSDPMVIGVTYKPDRFVEVFTHELLHRLLTDNNESAYSTQYTEEWEKLFGKQHSWNVIVHIPVHAMLQAIFDDVLKESKRTERDKKICKQWEHYNAAWEYVEETGYKQIIEKLKESYKKLDESRKV